MSIEANKTDVREFRNAVPVATALFEMTYF